MTRLNFIVLLALLASALFLVQTSYQVRRSFAELDRARDQQHKLQREFLRLEAERQAQATHLRVEKVARERLAMRAATAAVTHYVSDPSASGAGAGATQ